MCVGLFLSLSCTCVHLHGSGLVCLASKLSLWSHRTNLTDERKKKKRVRERKRRGGAARRDESAAEVLSRGEEETEEQGGRGQGRGESELS